MNFVSRFVKQMSRWHFLRLFKRLMIKRYLLCDLWKINLQSASEKLESCLNQLIVINGCHRFNANRDSVH